MQLYAIRCLRCNLSFCLVNIKRNKPTCAIVHIKRFKPLQLRQEHTQAFFSSFVTQQHSIIFHPFSRLTDPLATGTKCSKPKYTSYASPRQLYHASSYLCSYLQFLLTLIHLIFILICTQNASVYFIFLSTHNHTSSIFYFSDACVWRKLPNFI